MARRIFSLDVELSALRRRARAASRRCGGRCARGRRADAARAHALRGRRQDAADDQLLLGGDARDGRSGSSRWRATAARVSGAGARSRACRPRVLGAQGALRLPRRRRCRGSRAAWPRAGSTSPPGSAARRPPTEVREAILAEHGFGPYAAEGLLRILGRHEYLALDSWVRKQYRQLLPGPREDDRRVDRAPLRALRRATRASRCGSSMTRDWHEGGGATLALRAGLHMSCADALTPV